VFCYSTQKFERIGKAMQTHRDKLSSKTLAFSREIEGLVIGLEGERLLRQAPKVHSHGCSPFSPCHIHHIL